jgi:hypothetical protein
MNDTDKRDDDARLMLQITVDDIKVGKNRLWNSTYYILSLYAALIAFSISLNLRLKDNWIKYFLLVFGCIITVYAIYHLIESHTSIARYRKRLKSVTSLLHKEVRELYDTIPGYPNFHRYFFSLTFPFIILIIGGYILVLISLFEVAISNLVWFIFPLALIIDSAAAIYVYFKE